VKKLALWCGVLVFLAAAMAVWKYDSVQSAEQAADALAFVSVLVRDHIHLFPPGEQDALRETHRRIRESEWLSRRSREPQARTELHEAFMQTVWPLLDGITELKQVSLDRSRIRILPPGPLSLPGDSGALLFKVTDGPGENHYRLLKLDLAAIGARTDFEAVLPSSGGVTWILISLKNVPVGPTTLRAAFRKGDQLFQELVAVTTPLPGRLGVTILSDDTGQPTPAMVRLVWKTDGSERRPPNAIEFSPQFENQGNSSSERPANLPGEILRSNWWCVPGPFEMLVSPGEWEITIRRGVEHVPVTDVFRVVEESTIEKTYRPRRWVDMRHHGWYSGDAHVHGRIVSDTDADNLMAWARAEDIRLCNIVKMGDIYRTFFEQRGFGKEYRVQDGDYILSPGQECPRTHAELGHTLAMNIKSMVRDTDRYFLYDWVFDQVRAQGGLSGYAHVLSNSFHVHRDMSINVPKNKVDFAELMQFGQLGTDLYYEFLNLGFKLTAAAGSDVPWGGTVGEVRMYAYLGRQPEPFSPDAWFEAVRKGRTFVTNGPMLEFRVDDALPGDEVAVSDNRMLRVQARAWGKKGHMTPSRLEIIQLGEVINSVQTGPSGEELDLDFQVDSADGFWIAARAEGSDGSRAHTTPVYVTRTPLRFWKYNSVEKLIDQRLESLRQVEKLVAEARTEADSENAGFVATQLAAQGSALMERVQAARLLYEGLGEQHQKEGGLRRPLTR
jgi:hypothetical protein